MISKVLARLESDNIPNQNFFRNFLFINASRFRFFTEDEPPTGNPVVERKRMHGLCWCFMNEVKPISGQYDKSEVKADDGIGIFKLNANNLTKSGWSKYYQWFMPSEKMHGRN